MTTYSRRLTDGPRGEPIDDACRARRRQLPAEAMGDVPRGTR